MERLFQKMEEATFQTSPILLSQNVKVTQITPTQRMWNHILLNWNTFYLTER